MALLVHWVQVKLEFGILVYEERGKLGQLVSSCLMNSKFLAIIQLHPHCYFIVPSASPSFENVNGNLAKDNPGAGSSFPLSQCQIRIRIMNFRFCGRRKTAGQEPTTNLTHRWHQVWESNLGHNDQRQGLSPFPYPCSLCVLESNIPFDFTY